MLVIAMSINIELGNQLHYSCRRLAERCGLPYAATLKAWHWLERHDYLRSCLDDYGQTRSWKLSPYLAWKGRPHKARTAQKMWDAEGQLTRLAAKWSE